MSIIGLDIGFNKFGICGLSDIGIVSSFVIANKEKKVDEKKYYTMLSQLLKNTNSLLHMLRHSNLVVIEKPFGVKGYAVKLHELLGVLKYKLIEWNVPYVEVPQTTLKKFATGKGNAQKSDMVKQALKEFGFEAETEDEVDAFWCMKVGLCLANDGSSFSNYVYTSFSKARVELVSKLQIVK